MATPAERAVSGFLDHLVVERGASPHTVSGYRRDLNRYLGFLAGRGIVDLAGVTEPDVTAFLVALQSATPEHKALSVPSATRALVAVRSLHTFAAGEGITADSPAAAVHPPKPLRRLPKALSLDQVTALLAAPDVTTPEGLRDAALLELLYAT